MNLIGRWEMDPFGIRRRARQPNGFGEASLTHFCAATSRLCFALRRATSPTRSNKPQEPIARLDGSGTELMWKLVPTVLTRSWYSVLSGS